MKVIIEVEGYTGIGYKRQQEGKMLFKVNIEGYRKIYEGTEYFILIGTDGRLLEDAFNYINNEIVKGSLKQKERSFIALKLLYSFMELFYIRKLSEIDSEQINRLVAFLRGGSIKDHQFTFYCTTRRSNETINYYFGVYRKFFKYRKVQDSIFDEARIVQSIKGGNGFFSHAKRRNQIRYETSRAVSEQEEVPPYISFEEYVKLIKVVEAKYTLREKVLLKLMYEYGLRIGEVLGLTVEDIIDRREEKADRNEIELRNRVSDKPWQHCKGCMTVNSHDDYKTSTYLKKGDKRVGYQTVQISDNTLNLISEYMNEYILNSFISNKVRKNLYSKGIADCVKSQDSNKKNFYIFVGKNFTPITGTAWNRILKGLFIEVGIPIDTDRKRDGLNHKFRHGFAMTKVLVEGFDELRLQRALRHSNPNSCRVYFNPTPEDYKKFALLKDELLKMGGVSFSEILN